MGKRLSQLNSVNTTNPEDYLLLDNNNFYESKKIQLKDINLKNFDTSEFYDKAAANQTFIRKGEILPSFEVDQTYNPESENAQSGKSVAEAVATEQKRADNTFANALKGSKSGSVIQIDDISPINQELYIDLSSDSIRDFSKIFVKKVGKNLFDINNPLFSATIPDLAPHLPKIEDGIIYFNTWYGYRGGAGFVIPMPPNTTFTVSFDVVSGEFVSELAYAESVDENNALVNYGRFLPQYNNVNRLTYTQPSDQHFICFILDCIGGYYKCGIKNLQIEYGTVATKYEDYKSQVFNADINGVIKGVENESSSMTLSVDENDVTINCEYNRDINKAFAALEAAIATNNS